MANFFPRWSNLLPLKLAFCGGVLGALTIAGVWYYFTPKYTRVGYQPDQPVSFDHSLHAGQLGLDCRYCHSFVGVSSHSNVPTTQTCMRCHSAIKAQSPKLTAIRESWETGRPMNWVRIHETPDYVYFNHAAHVNRGVSCKSCHGQINEMKVVRHDQPLSMGWCLACHRNPEKHLRPLEEVYNLDWKPADGTDQEEVGRALKAKWAIQPPVDCAGCHR